MMSSRKYPHTKPVSGCLAQASQTRVADVGISQPPQGLRGAEYLFWWHTGLIQVWLDGVGTTTSIIQVARATNRDKDDNRVAIHLQNVVAELSGQTC